MNQMTMERSEELQGDSQVYVVLGQRYAYATAALILGIACFVNLVGLEKAILAIVFGWLALKTTPLPALRERRMWAKTGIVLGSLLLIVVPTIILLNIDRLRLIIEALEKLSSGR
ncbi:MAG: hypothetical protein ABJB97_06195 [Acidobacteriota bacterium]